MRHLHCALALAFLCLVESTGQAETSRSALERDFGLRLIDTEGDGRWDQDEIDAVHSLVTRLPKNLATVGRQTDLGRVRVFKGKGQEPERTHEALFSIMRWQMVVDAAPPSQALTRAEYLKQLQRRLVHHLLHAFDTNSKVSRSDEWRRLSGWRPRRYLGLTVPLPREAANQDPRGYATPDGLFSAEADFASYGEIFFVPEDEELIEESIACRAPDKFRFFATLFASVEPPMRQIAVSCRGSAEGFLDDLVFVDPITRLPLDLGPIDEDAVEGFELLYATPGVQDAAEIAGHLVLRIKLRNNQRAEDLGLENPHDLVVSFLADTDVKSAKPASTSPDGPRATRPDPPKTCEESWLGLAAPKSDEVDAVASVMQALKGLSGGFLTTFDRQTLQQTVRTYTVDQDRNLLRYRLNVTSEQKSRLIERLYLAKKNYKTKYYFFDRNCASVLVQVIGEGLGVSDVADFDPMVVPPNALVALLVRKGLASPVYPSFYGYRKRAHVAQELLREQVAEHFPSIEPADLTAKDMGRRVGAYEALDTIADGDAEASGRVYRLAALAQEAEMAFVDKSAPCEHYASRPVEVLRTLQQKILSRQANVQADHAIDVNRAVYDRYAVRDQLDGQLGSDHTNLSAVSVAAVQMTDERDHSTDSRVQLGLAMHRQDLGSIANQSMQRATSVILGEALVDLAGEGDGLSIDSWRLTGMKIRKLKERLDSVPSYFAPEGSLGLGLTVLDWRGRSRFGLTQSDLVGGELIANLVSSRLYEDYLILSVGGKITSTWDRARPTEGAFGVTSVGLPVYLEGLTTFGSRRSWQLRGRGEMRYTVLAGSVANSFAAEASLVHRLTEVHGSELLIRAGGTLTRDPLLAPEGLSTLQIGMEWNRW